MLYSSWHSNPIYAFLCGPQAIDIIDIAKAKIQDKESEKAWPHR